MMEKLPMQGLACSESRSMTYGARNIWGVTAGILRNLHERLYS